VRTAGEARESRLLPVRDLLGDQQRAEVAIGPGLPFCPLHQVAPHASGIGERQSLEEQVEVGLGRDHDRPPTPRERTAVLGIEHRSLAAAKWRTVNDLRGRRRLVASRGPRVRTAFNKRERCSRVSVPPPCFPIVSRKRELLHIHRSGAMICAGPPLQLGLSCCFWFGL
jgi:hypothetical protein